MSSTHAIPRTNAFDGCASAGVDAKAERRPGIPMELEPPRPMGAAHWEAPDRQPDPGNILRRKGLPELTPVFGTAVPPRGVSGGIRRGAYRIAEHRTSHWLFLLLADRVDALEHGARRLPFLLSIGGSILAAATATRARRTLGRRRHWWRLG